MDSAIFFTFFAFVLHGNSGNFLLFQLRNFWHYTRLCGFQ